MSYVWAHSIDTGSVYNGGGVFGFLNPLIDRGASDFDIRHAVSMAVSYSLPGQRSGVLRSALLGHWALDGIYRVQSARPLDLNAGTYATQYLVSLTRRPDLVAGVPQVLSDPAAPGGTRLNPAAFVSPPANVSRQGTLGRNVIRGFGLQQLDLALRRSFPFGDRFALEFRADLFNAFQSSEFCVTCRYNRTS
jgi:hypothetical protein